MAFDYNSLLYNPMLNFGMSMLAANAPSRDPRSSSLAWAMSQGLQGAQEAYRAQEEMENRRIYADAQQQYLKERQEEAKRKQARAMSLAGVMNPQQQVIGQTTDVPGLPPGGVPMNVYAPPTAEQRRAQAMQQIQQLSQVDPDAAMKMLEAMNSGTFPGIPAMPEPPKPTQPPGYFQFLDPDEQEQAAEYLGGLRSRPKAPAVAGGRGRAPAGGGSPKQTLSKTEWNKRIAISNARASIAKMGLKREVAEEMAKKDPGFKAALTLANQRMPGDDPAWESTNTSRAAAMKSEGAVGGKSQAQLQAELDSITEPGLRRLKIEAARRRGIVLVDKKPQERSFFDRFRGGNTGGATGRF